MKSVLLVIPTFRDTARLQAFLPDLSRQLEARSAVEIVVVDDGSGPKFSDALEELVRDVSGKSQTPVSLIRLKRNVGKGGAIYAGWGDGKGVDWLAFVDADGAVSASEVERMLSEIDCTDLHERADALIASRVKMLGRTVERSVKRHLIGRIFATLASELTGLAVYDSQCGCKFVRREAYAAVRSKLTELRFAFDVDLLFHLHRAGYRIVEFPVDWRDIPGSKVSLIRDSFLMLFSLLRLRKS